MARATKSTKTAKKPAMKAKAPVKKQATKSKKK